MRILTKILATLGPASSKPETIEALIHNGCDAFRINFSHGSNSQREQILQAVRAVEAKMDHPLAVCADLCGPKIRVGPMTGGGVLLAEGQDVVIQREPMEGTAGRISTTLAELIDAVRPGQHILLDDGRIRLEVCEVHPPEEAHCRVVCGGVLGSGKGVNLPHTDLSLSALTEKDHADVEWIVKHDFDYIALSFVRTGKDVQVLRDLLNDYDCGAHIIAKIEKPQALDNLEEILSIADGVMVARGDLGVEMDLPAVPVAQKHIAALARQAAKPCIIATQMLESMIQSATPTRAEISDVANAVLDYADAVMLSGETAVGDYPVEAVRYMDETVMNIQQYHEDHYRPVEPPEAEEGRSGEAIVAAARTIFETVDLAAIAVYTVTGATARLLAKQRPPCPILALSPNMATVRKMALYYGVLPHQAETPEHTRDVLQFAADFAKSCDVATTGDRILVLSGRPIGVPGHTNTMVVHAVD